jgi:hypothetical protein
MLRASYEVTANTISTPHSKFEISILVPGFEQIASYCVTQILGLLSDWCRTYVGRTNRKLWVHADNARPHTATVTLQFMPQNAMRRVPHSLSTILTRSGTLWFLYLRLHQATSVRMWIHGPGFTSSRGQGHFRGYWKTHLGRRLLQLDGEIALI